MDDVSVSPYLRHRPLSLVLCAVLGFDRVPWWGTLCITIGCALITALIVWFVVCPRLKKKIQRE